MAKVFFSVAMSLDGYIAPIGMDLARAPSADAADWQS